MRLERGHRRKYDGRITEEMFIEDCRESIVNVHTFRIRTIYVRVPSEKSSV